MGNDKFQGNAVLQELKKCGISYVIGLPEAFTGAVISAAVLDSNITWIPVCREAEAFVIAAGLYTGGKESVIVIQSTGVYDSGDSIRAINVRWKLPQLVIIGYRGSNRPASDNAVIYIEPILNLWGIKYYIVTPSSNDICSKISAAYHEAHANYETVAILVKGALK